MGQPTLSVMMANYNHGKYIARAIEAVVSQSRPPDEYIIVDDGSTDNSVEIIDPYAQCYPFIRFVRNERNRGALAAFERAVSMATGGYIYGAAADDKVLPGFFEKSMSLLARYPQAGLCCSDPAWLDDRTGVIRENKLYWSNEPCYFSPDELTEVIRGGYIAGHTSITKRTALLEAGGYLPELRWHCDWFASLVIGFRHGICYIPEPLATLRVLPGSYSASGRRDWSQQREVLDHLLRLLKTPAYRDVLPYFARSGVMSHFRDEIVGVVLSNPEHWDFQSVRLIRGPLRNEARRVWNEVRRMPRRTLSLVTPSPVKRVYRRVCDRQRRTSRDSQLL